MKNYLIVFGGGGLGSMVRYWLSGAVYRFLPQDFPYGTLCVNISGSFLIGFLMTSLLERFIASPQMRLFLVIGFLGGFTTFSSFSYETVALMRDGEIFKASVNVLSSVAGCIFAAYCGTVVGRAF